MASEDNKILPTETDAHPSAQEGEKKGQKRKKNKVEKLRLDSFSDSLDRPPASSDEEDEDEEAKKEEELKELMPPPPKKKRKKVKALKVPISRMLTCPDMVRVDRCRRLPEYGPRILFFSGGTALRELSRTLKSYTHNSIHLLTPFDSGGSTAEIRRAFHVSAVGDFRNRLVALSDESALGSPEVINFFALRLDQSNDKARMEFANVLQGQHPLVKAVQMPMRKLLLRHLQWFSNRMPVDFNMGGASMGNLVITGCWLEHDKDIVAALYLLWNLLGVKGKVRPITGAHLHLRTMYEDGVEEVGQHLMGQRKPIKKITKIDLVKSLKNPDGVRQKSEACHCDYVSKELIKSCDLIVFPMGSFFGSVLSNLLANGVGRSIYKSKTPKIYVPNTGHDPEMHGYSLSGLIGVIVRMVEDDVLRELKELEEEDESCAREPPVINPSDVVNHVVVDTENCKYSVEIDKEKVESMGVVVIDLPLVNVAHLDPKSTAVPQVENSTTKVKSLYIDPHKLSEVLITLGS